MRKNGKNTESNSKQFYSAEDIAQILGVSRSKAYDILKRDDLPVLKIGKNVRVLVEDFDRFIVENLNGSVPTEYKKAHRGNGEPSHDNPTEKESTDD